MAGLLRGRHDPLSEEGGAPPPGDQAKALLAQLAEAHAAWQAAERLFAEATEPELIDWAALHLKACEEYYVYLWRQARRAGIRGQVRLRS